MHTTPTPAEREAIALLTEEMGESLQVLGKIGRHGFTAADETVDPPVSYDNRADLNKEVRDVLAAIVVGMSAGILDRDLMDLVPAKLRKVQPLLHYIDLTEELKGYPNAN